MQAVSLNTCIKFGFVGGEGLIVISSIHKFNLCTPHSFFQNTICSAEVVVRSHFNLKNLVSNCEKSGQKRRNKCAKMTLILNHMKRISRKEGNDYQT